jgi:hypothetical protein
VEVAVSDDDDDLTGIVLNVRRNNPEATKRFVNHPLTRAYLEAGVRIVEREVTAGTASDERGLLRPFETLRRETVIAELVNGTRTPATSPTSRGSCCGCGRSVR